MGTFVDPREVHVIKVCHCICGGPKMPKTKANSTSLCDAQMLGPALRNPSSHGRLTCRLRTAFKARTSSTAASIVSGRASKPVFTCAACWYCAGICDASRYVQRGSARCTRTPRVPSLSCLGVSGFSFMMLQGYRHAVPAGARTNQTQGIARLKAML